MTLQVLILFYFITLGGILLNLGLLLSGQLKLLAWTGWIPVFSGFLAWTGGIIYSGHPPVYNKFETLQQVVLILLLLEQIQLLRSGKTISASWYLALALQAMVLIFGLEPDSDGYYMYEKLYVILFFQLRISSMGLFACALAATAGSLLKGMKEKEKSLLEHRSRNFMLLGAAIYLAGEFSGSWWAQLWWGDPWHWSKGFFYATMMFLLALLASHVPGRYLRRPALRPLFSILPLCFILIIYLFSH